MNEKIKAHVDAIFQNAPMSRRATELRDELVANLSDRYNDLLEQGHDEETAYKIAIAGIGDMDEVIRGLREQEVFDPVQVQIQRQKSALLISVAVAIYILSIIFPIIFSSGLIGGYNNSMMVLGVVLMFICWSVATMLIVFNALSKPKYVKMEDTVVEEFKEWKVNRSKGEAMRKSINSIVYMLATVVFLCLGFFAGMWHPGWIVYVLAAVITHIIKLVMAYRESGDQ